MVEHIRTNSTSKDGRKNCDIFENELENARKNLSRTNIPPSSSLKSASPSISASVEDTKLPANNTIPIDTIHPSTAGDESPVRVFPRMYAGVRLIS